MTVHMFMSEIPHYVLILALIELGPSLDKQVTRLARPLKFLFPAYLPTCIRLSIDFSMPITKINFSL